MMTTLSQFGFFYGYHPYGGWLPYVICLGIPMLIGMFAAMRVQSVFGWASKIDASCGMTGAEVATEIMRAHNITDVSVEPSHGFLTDHYDPSAKVLRLSESVFNSRSVAAIGVAAHEAGHALQHAEGYGPLKLRSAVVPVAKFGGVASQFALMIGMLILMALGKTVAATTFGVPILLIGIVGLLCVAFFQLITLPVEFDASNRAKRILTTTNILTPGEETHAMHKVLNAAAMTYVAALVSTIGTIIYYLLVVLSSTNRRN